MKFGLSLILFLAGIAPAASAADSAQELLLQARAAERKDKKDPAVWTLRGRAALAEGKQNRAFKCFSKALKLDPLNAGAYYERGRIYESRNKLDEAANEYQAALKADPSHGDARKAWDALSARVEKPSGAN
jgi:tetratricopeptide (TPR) repeat protein